MKGRISNKDVYDGLWKCRDFEIDHVWQRAVFLTAFLLACYAGYGTVLVSFSTADHVRMPMQLANALLFAVALAGLVLSLTWIMMAKGSKAWYEHYESALQSVEDQHPELYEVSCRIRVLGADKSITGFSRPCTSSWLWNTKGGAYSVAKINIVIGHVSAVVWVLVCVAHVVVANNDFRCWRDLSEWLTGFVTAKHLISIAISSLLLFWLYSLKQIRSTFLKDSKCN